jgi:hypothetical protein
MINTYAKIENGIVVNLILCSDSEISSQNGNHVKVTSETNQAVIGYEYNIEKNKFKSWQPFASWILNEDTLLWEAPVVKPEGAIVWNETDQSWIIPE